MRALVHGNALDRAGARRWDVAYTEGRPEADAAVSVPFRNTGARADRERTTQRRGDLVHCRNGELPRASRRRSNARDSGRRWEAGGMDGAANAAWLRRIGRSDF